ncbi:hypothetical protein [Actinophytocola sp.]|uniref:hypothetical protein n=1 Tax=Actinophytocola sp. TaxID=1872138 RepID=UPI002ED0D9B3
MPIYPAAMTTVAQPLMPPGHWHPARVTAAVLCFVGLVLVISSSFLPLYSGELDAGFDRIEVTITPWAAELEEQVADGLGDVPRVGYPMVFSAVFLACAAAACWYAASPAARAAAGRVAGLVTSVGTAFLIGTAWTTALLVSNGVDVVLLLGVLNEDLDTNASYLAGYWLLLTACLLAFAASVLSLLPTRQPAAAWQPPVAVNPFMATPPFGIALPVQAPLTGQPTLLDPLTGQPVGQGPFVGQSSPQAPPGAVDPLTGQPLGPEAAASPPGGVPVVYPLPQAPASAYPLAGQQLQPQAPVDPLTGQPRPLDSPIGGPQVEQPVQVPVAVDPLTGQPLSPSQVIPVSPPTGIPASPPVPFTADPVVLANGTPPPAVAEPAPIVLPDAPPLPERLPGPAIPATEDPLAEPPRA